MDHVAIMNRKWKLIDKILSGEKTIESRWYIHKVVPWDRIQKDDVIYFKDSGMLVTAKAKVDRVICFSRGAGNFDSSYILHNYGSQICIQDIRGFNDYADSKNYCILIFLKNPEAITPFQIDKTGFGSACAWMIINDIEKIKK